MNRIVVHLWIISLVFCSIAKADEAYLQGTQDQKTNAPSEFSQPILSQEHMISQDQYVAGGLLGTVVGFGLGHMVQSRSDTEKQDIFMLGEIGVIGASMVMLISANTKECTGPKQNECINDRSNSTNSALGLGVLAFVGLRVWEIYDLWSYPHVQPVKSKAPEATLFIHPQSSDQVATSFVLRF